ncbi:hypothetical protein BH09DEP1_BH09DEP1_3500 [soil metagenome]
MISIEQSIKENGDYKTSISNLSGIDTRSVFYVRIITIIKPPKKG